MGYYDQTIMPFVNSLATTFPLCDNYFSSVMAQTYPNRRYFMAGTSLGLINDTLNEDEPPNGTIFEALNKYDISWKNYYSSDPSALIWEYLANKPNISGNLVNISEFFTDAAAGKLPAYSMVDPNFGTQSEEDPQDVQYGDQFMSQVITAVMNSPQWSSTLLVWTYDEGGGYYDHVRPPKAKKPDAVKPNLASGDYPGSFNQYGFRVPSGVVSPYARADYVSTVVHDHTSILKLIETKWNLPAFTHRDANADDLLDCVDLTSKPAFLKPPKLAAPLNPTTDDGCEKSGPGTIPPPSYVVTG
jgi:phospholipase C